MKAAHLVALACLLPACKPAAGSVGPPPPPRVQVAQVVVQDVPIYAEAVGQTLGSLDIAIRARVDGILEELHFHEGDFVKKGDLLYTIDPEPFEAKVREAEGKLAEAKARLVGAESNLKRVKPLVEIDALSKRTLDDAILEFDAAKGLVAANEAIVESAKINLGYTTIKSPIAGLIGASEAYPGDYVGRYPGPVVLTTVSQLDPMRVRFSITERAYLRIVRKYGSRADYDKVRDKEGQVGLELILADGSTFPHKGTVAFLGREVDARTGTIMVEARFPNPDRALRPGLFARVRAAIETRRNATLVPQKAVIETQGVYSVLVVGQDGTVQSKRVEAGARVGELWQVQGVDAKDRVVVSGLHLARPGSKVEAVDAAAAESETEAPGR